VFFAYLKVFRELADLASVSSVPIKVQVLALVGVLGAVSVQHGLTDTLGQVTIEGDDTTTHGLVYTCA
jgi:hypothetical protein